MPYREDSDLIANIIWWLRGYMAAKPESNISCSSSGYLSPDHIAALTHAKADAEKKEELEKKKEVKDVKP